MRLIKNTLIFVLFAIALSACGGGGGGNESSSKNLFSLWNDVNTNAPLDIRNGSFSTALPISFFFAGGAQCDCTLTVIGTQASGTYVINSCTYLSGSGAADPGCNALPDTGTYAKTSTILTLANSSLVSTDYD